MAPVVARRILKPIICGSYKHYFHSILSCIIADTGNVVVDLGMTLRNVICNNEILGGVQICRDCQNSGDNFALVFPLLIRVLASPAAYSLRSRCGDDLQLDSHNFPVDRLGTYSLPLQELAVVADEEDIHSGLALDAEIAMLFKSFCASRSRVCSHANTDSHRVVAVMTDADCCRRWRSSFKYDGCYRWPARPRVILGLLTRVLLVQLSHSGGLEHPFNHDLVVCEIVLWMCFYDSLFCCKPGPTRSQHMIEVRVMVLQTIRVVYLPAMYSAARRSRSSWSGELLTVDFCGVFPARRYCRMLCALGCCVSCCVRIL